MINKTITWFILGSTYFIIETLWRGSTSLWMLLIGGICGLAVGAVNQVKGIYSKPIWLQSLLAAVIILAVEFTSGYILNIKLGLYLWDYTTQPLNIMGQICPVYGVLWFLLAPFAIWLEDTLQWVIWQYRRALHKPYTPSQIPLYSLGSIYSDLLTFK